MWKPLLALLLAFAAPPAALPEARAAATATAPVLARIRTAAGAPALARLSHGLVIEEQSEGRTRRLLLGAMQGEVRVGDEFGYDGDLRWRADPRRGGFVPMNHGLFDRLAMPLWIRSLWWLDPRSGFRIAPLPAQGESGMIALQLTSRDGLVPATLYIDRTTWLPRRLIIPSDQGPFTIAYGDYRPVAGLSLPFRTEETYRGTTRIWTASPRPMRAGEARFSPSPIADARFDPSATARVSARQGMPFGGGGTPHVYVTPELDGRPGGWFLFDSGADAMMIDAKLADSLAMPVLGRATAVGSDGNPRSGTLRKGRSFRLGRLSFPAPLYVAVDFSANNAPPLEKRAGVIGYDVFARAIVEYTGRGEAIAICDPAAYRLPAGASWQKLSFLDSTPAVSARFEGGHEALFMIDTGSATSVAFYADYVARESMLRGRATRQIHSEGVGGTFTGEIGKLGWFEIGGRRFDDLNVDFRTGGISREGGAGVIGREILSRFTTIFDYGRRRIAFLPLGPEPSPSGCADAA